MKIRTGFVSNSSSTSYTCEICGASESGWDSQGIEDFGFYQCENEHVICQEEAIGDVEHCSNDSIGECISATNCPICQFEVLSETDTALYLKKLTGIKEADVFAQIKKLNPRRKVLRDAEYIAYACGEANTNQIKILKEVKKEYKTYKDFRKYLHSRDKN